MLRISLIIAIVAGLAAAGLNFFKVKEVLTTTMSERDAEKDAKVAAQNELTTTKGTLKKTTAELDTTKKNLASTEASLKKETARAEKEQKHGEELAGKLSKTEGERDKAQQELSQWNALPLKPEQIKGLIADLKNEKEKVEVSEAEKAIVAKEMKKYKELYTNLVGENVPPPAMPGVKGTIVAVDPKFDFVVLNVGANQGALERGELLVNRNGKLVAKVKIFSVEQNRCIANILPKWKQGEVQEGDQVLY